jgi:GAF domain-containing protein
MASGRKRSKDDGGARRPAASAMREGAGADRSLAHRLAEALEQQAATSEILHVISRSRSDVQPVFEAIASNALHLCDATFSAIYAYDGELIRIAALHGMKPEAVAAFRGTYPTPPGRGGATQRSILTRQIVHMPDVREEAEYSFLGVAAAAAYRSVLAIPLLRDGQAIGTIGVYRDAPGPFPDSQIDALKTFADQALIAIENVRQFNELQEKNRDLTEALEQQTATSEILGVISQARTDVQPVFDTIANAALRLCNASSANVFTFDGELVHIAALVNLNPAYSETMRSLFPRPPGRYIAATRAVATREVVEVPDVLADADYAISAHAVSGGFRSVLAVPLLRGDVPIGSIAVGRPEAGRYPATQIALLQTFADQAVIAIENVRLFNELQARNRDLTESLEQQTATSEILRVMSRSQTDVRPVFETIAAAAFKLCNAHFSNVFTFDGESLHVAASQNVHPEYADALQRLYPRPPSRDTAATRALLTRQVVTIPDVCDDPEYIVQRAAVSKHYAAYVRC